MATTPIRSIALHSDHSYSPKQPVQGQTQTIRILTSTNMSGLPSSSSAPCWVRHPSLLLFRLQPSIFWTVLLLNRNLPRDTPWHTSSMTTAARVNLLLGKVECDSSKKPWGASSPEDFLARLDTIFLPNVVDEVAVWLLKDETATRCDSSSHLAVRPYNKAAFTEQILVTVLHRVEEAHAGAAMRLRLSSITSKAYELPAGLIHRRVPAWVKNPILLCLDCRGVTIKVIKQINTEMPADDDWWRDHMDTPTRVSVITERVKKLFHWHIGQSGEELSATPPLQRKAGIPAADDAAMQTRVTSPYNTASLARWIFRRHVAMVIEDDVMQYDYTVPGISSKER